MGNMLIFMQLFHLKGGDFVSVWEDAGSEPEFQMISKVLWCFPCSKLKGVLLRARTASLSQAEGG